MTEAEAPGSLAGPRSPPRIHKRQRRRSLLIGALKQFGDLSVLADVSLAPSWRWSGRRGSGKSTLLRCVNLLESVDDGEIRLDGMDIADPEFEADDARRRIRIVFQSFILFPHLTVLDNHPGPSDESLVDALRRADICAGPELVGEVLDAGRALAAEG